MPLIPNQLEKSLLADHQFHLNFINKYGLKLWEEFVAGNDMVFFPDPMLAPFSDNKVNGEGFIHVAQWIVTWVMPDLLAPATKGIKLPKVTLDTPLILYSGKNYEEFIEEFKNTIFKKYDTKQLKYEVSGEGYGAREAGYELFPGVGEFTDVAADWLKDYFTIRKPKRVLDHAKIYQMFLACDYDGPDSLPDFVDFLVEKHKQKELNEAAEQIYDAFSRGMGDAYADAVESKYVYDLKKQIRNYEFPHAKFLVGNEYDGDWDITVTLRDIFDFAGSAGPDFRENDFLDYFIGEEKINLKNEYDYPDSYDDISWDYGYQNFHEEFPKDIIEGIL